MIEVTMRTRSIQKRLARLEKVIGPKCTEDGAELILLEELCRQMWNRNREHFMKLAKNTNYQLFVYQFQAEQAAEAAEEERRRLRSRGRKRVFLNRK